MSIVTDFINKDNMRRKLKELNLDLYGGYVEDQSGAKMIWRSDVTINIAEDFSRYPYGRTMWTTSAKKFKNKFLKPFIEHDASFIIILDGTNGYGSSWLHEAFGNLLREYPKEKRQRIKNRIKFISKDDPSLIKEIEEYMNEAINE